MLRASVRALPGFRARQAPEIRPLLWHSMPGHKSDVFNLTTESELTARYLVVIAVDPLGQKDLRSPFPPPSPSGQTGNDNINTLVPGTLMLVAVEAAAEGIFPGPPQAEVAANANSR